LSRDAATTGTNMQAADSACDGRQRLFSGMGKPARELHAGDVVTIPADVKHWHGAARIVGFVHLAVEVNSEKGPATWLEPVSDEDYKKLK